MTDVFTSRQLKYEFKRLEGVVFITRNFPGSYWKSKLFMG